MSSMYCTRDARPGTLERSPEDLSNVFARPKSVGPILLSTLIKSSPDFQASHRNRGGELAHGLRVAVIAYH